MFHTLIWIRFPNLSDFNQAFDLNPATFLSNMEKLETIDLPDHKLAVINTDLIKNARSVDLIYVSDSQEGILRKRRGAGFYYVFRDKTLKDKLVLERIKSLVIPPAWEKVWICSKENGHLQVTGLDNKKRKQYKYHPLWNSVRNQTKFYRLKEFGKVLPIIRLQLEKDLSLPGMPVEKVLATIVSLMERTHIRIGNNMYEKLYGSFGLTTLKDNHVKISGQELRFIFKGKKGVEHDIHIKNKKLSRIVQKCKDIPGKELFQYVDESGTRKTVDSGMVNHYIKTICGQDFTAKDFRTWAGTLEALLAFKEIGFFNTVTESKKNIAQALEMVSKQLGNTKNVCKTYYVHPVVLTLYENGTLKKYIKELDAIEVDDDKAGLTSAELVLMKILTGGKRTLR